MVHKATNKQIKDSTVVSVDKSQEFVAIDSTSTSKNKEIETADLVVVFKDTATGFLVLTGDSISIPASAIKEIRHKRKKQKESDQSTKVTTDKAILTDTKQTVKVTEKVISKDKKSTRISWIWLLLIIACVLLYISRKRIYAIYKAFTI
jgi:ATP-dependent helicase YprA (DUF1998 family)